MVSDRVLRVLLPALVLLPLWGCERTAPATRRNELVVVGTIGRQHATSTRFGLDQLRAMIRAIDPDVVLCEIPPDRLDTALREFQADGTVREPRVSQFPEYTEVLFPLAAELRFEIVPCAAWDADGDRARRATLDRLADEEPQRFGDARDALDWLATRLESEGLSDDPVGMHTPAYDALVAEALGAYAERLDGDLGPGGWQAGNQAHYALIDSALRSRAARGERCLLLFSAWHKYWLLRELRQRSDIRLRDLDEFWRP